MLASFRREISPIFAQVFLRKHFSRHRRFESTPLQQAVVLKRGVSGRLKERDSQQHRQQGHAALGISSCPGLSIDPCPLPIPKIRVLPISYADALMF